ncbi:hypothetical protein [Citrobacter sp. TSA-1]|uniref:hypothetical protein n=1 Tax=Citrobacter sp. TSA-1 TaxID=184912 RepID=UPI000BAE6A67|nr:hypothetical protein [Citrobacter sp. TSA-1]PAX79539.1 hypothetical protein CIK43_12275 [Citrobacter sp. TSA-1]QKE20592.1 hypothetical protein HF677_013305 [Citrobacter sp. TSA-1]
MLIAAQCETKLKTAALVHNTFNEVGRIGGFFFAASCTALVTRYSPEARENSTWGRVVLFCKTPGSSLRQINSAADNNNLQGEHNNDDLWLTVYGGLPCCAFLEG